MYITVLVGIPLVYLLFLALYVLVHMETLSFAFTFFPLALSYDALNDYVVTKRRRRGGQALQS
jgi:hypothetical protein